MQYAKEQYDEVLHDRYKALTVRQPYADLIASGAKTIEVRSKPTQYRGELMITASAAKGKKNSKNHGCTIAKVNLVGCKPLSELTEDEWEKTCLPQEVKDRVKATKKGYGWLLDNPRRVIEFPVKGQLGIWTLIYTKDTIIEYPNINSDF